MQREGQVRIPSGCAISGMVEGDGSRLCGENIIKSIATMHDRSNGLGGGFAGYGIYPEYKDYYAFHIFMITKRQSLPARNFWKSISILSICQNPTRKHPRITDEPYMEIFCNARCIRGLRTAS